MSFVPGEQMRPLQRVICAFLMSTWGCSTSEPVYTEESEAVRDRYEKTEHMVPMRDGVKLFSQVYAPRDTSRTYPILLTRTPYSIRPYGEDAYRSVIGPSLAFGDAGYIVVYQDVRGKFQSEGQFHHHVVYKAEKKSPEDVDESSDAYDTIDWLLANVSNHNGRVGLWGISYGGWQTAMGMIDAHPALKASSPQGSPADQFIGDDYFHHGAFRLMYAFGWTSSNARIRVGPSTEETKPFEFPTPDGYRFFLELGPVANVNKKFFNDQVPTWNEFVHHGTYDEYWQSKNVLKDIGRVNHPVLNVASWFDAEDYYGPLGIYYAIEKANPDNDSLLVAGPWRHGGWARADGDELGNIRFGSKTGQYFREKIELPFFNYYLKDEGEWPRTEAIVFETGANQWRTYERWPPEEAKRRNLYLHPGGGLSFDPPPESSSSAFDSYVSDPAKPVPYSAEIRNQQGHLWTVEDQRFAATRPDVLVYETEPLSEDVTIAGPIIASLQVSSSGSDADWVVKLIDVYPPDAPDNDPNPQNVRMGGFQMMLAGDVFRAKFRESYKSPKPLVPDEVTPIEFDLLDKHHTFLAGHKIMVQIQSSWFPLIDRNPQKFVNIFEAVGSDFQKATNRVYRSPRFASHIKLMVLER